MTEILISILMPVVFIFMGYTQIRKAEEVGIQKGGKTFLSNKKRFYICSALFLVFLIGAYIVLWTVQWGLALAVVSPGIILFMTAVTSYCAISDTHLHVSMTMKIGNISSMEVMEKGSNSYFVTFKYNQSDFSQTFDKDGYEYIKEAKRIHKELRKK